MNKQDILLNEAKIIRKDLCIGFKYKQYLICILCSKEFKAHPKGILQKYKIDHIPGCAECKQKIRYSENRKEEIKSLNDKFEFINVDLGGKQSQLVTVKNKVCGHIFETNLMYLLFSNVRCAVCGNKDAHLNFHNYSKPFLTVEEVNKKLKELFLKDEQKIICLNVEKYISSLDNNLEFLCKMGHKWQASYNNIVNNNSRCPFCARENMSKEYSFDTITVLKNFKKVHKNIYQYPHIDIEYKNRFSKLTIICTRHGKFKQHYNAHYNLKQGCPKCAIERNKDTKDDFIKKANQVHKNKYDYTYTDFQGYSNSKPYIYIVCPLHGKYKTKAGTHVFCGSGCPECVPRSYSKKCIEWLTYTMALDNIEIQHAENGGEYRIPNTNWSADGFCVETNTVYEFYGDAFHGNLDIYLEDDFCHPYDKTLLASNLYKNTIKREEKIREIGYNVISIWESVWDDIKNEF